MIRYRIATFLILLQVAYLVIAMGSEYLPSWSMFSINYPVNETQIVDENGKQLSIKKFLPQITYSLNKTSAAQLGKFICNKQKTAPLHIYIKGLLVWIIDKNCEIHEKI